MLTFDDIFGQPAAISALRHAYQLQRLPHGLIFAGPEGVGKATTARALGGLFLCESPQGDLPCGKCRSCVLSQARNHPDYHVVVKEMIRSYDKTGESKATEMSIDVIRHELVEPASRKSSMGQGKVFVIEKAELMNAAAQNSSLKILEEPQGRTIIILLTNHSGALLPTIRSRCQIIQFVPLSSETVLRELEKRNIPTSQATEAAALASGSLGVAIRWIEDGVIDHAKTLNGKMDNLLAGKPLNDLPDWLKRASEDYAEKQLVRDPLASKSEATRDGLAIYFYLAAEQLRSHLADTDDPENLERLCQAIDALAKAEVYLDANVTTSLIFQQIAATLESLFTTAGIPAR